MAPITKTLALAGAFFAVSGFAAPVEKRAVVWETVTDIVWTTVDVTTTIYPGQAHTTTATVVPVTTTTPAAAAVTTAEISKKESEVQPPVPETSTQAPAPAPAPQPTEQSTVAPEPAPAPAPTSSSTSQAPVATSSSSSPSSGSSGGGYTGSCDESSPCTGQMTYYDTATTASNPSSCGTTNDGETEFVLALPVGIMSNSDCGKSVTIEYGGVTQTGKVVDKCMGCDDSSIDLSRALFESFASLSEGRLSDATWYIQ